ncbi:hypothetical protein BS17DRAFT_821473 [Gyrodon lividus]|nr:hypothetical protein BS17DRAFT_821473 [Gyrodon lividus]
MPPSLFPTPSPFSTLPPPPFPSLSPLPPSPSLSPHSQHYNSAHPSKPDITIPILNTQHWHHPYPHIPNTTTIPTTTTPIPIANIMSELNYHLKSIPICGDNQGSIFMATNPITEKHSKHINIHYHYVHKVISQKG